jgi:DNA invertase Pin-like site-specific DNA recombinase
VANL